MTTIELTPEQQRALDAKGEKRVIDPRTKQEYLMLPIDEAQEYLDFMDARDPEQLAIARTAVKHAARAIREDA